jgi:hypothetical protein
LKDARFRLYFAILIDVHRILLNFRLYKTKWRVGFLEADCRTSLPVRLNFADSERIREMHRRFAPQLLDDIHALAHGIEIGRGGFWIELNEEQYSKLK